MDTLNERRASLFGRYFRHHGFIKNVSEGRQDYRKKKRMAIIKTLGYQGYNETTRMVKHRKEYSQVWQGKRWQWLLWALKTNQYKFKWRKFFRRNHLIYRSRVCEISLSGLWSFTRQNRQLSASIILLWIYKIKLRRRNYSKYSIVEHVQMFCYQTLTDRLKYDRKDKKNLSVRVQLNSFTIKRKYKLEYDITI